MVGSTPRLGLAPPISSAQTNHPLLCGPPDLSTRRVRFGNPSVAPSLVTPRCGSSDSHRRSCLLAPSITGAYLEPHLATEAEAVCTSARWLHKSEPDILFGSTSFQFGGNHARGGINRTI